MTVGILWVYYLQWHQLPRWVFLMYLPPPCYPIRFLLNPLEDVKKEVQGNTKSNRDLQASAMVNKWKKLKTRMLSFLFATSMSSSSTPWFIQHSRSPRVGQDGIVNFTLLFDLSFLYWLYPYHRTKWQVPIEIKKIEPINETSTLQHKLRDYKQWLQSWPISSSTL